MALTFVLRRRESRGRSWLQHAFFGCATWVCGDGKVLEFLFPASNLQPPQNSPQGSALDRFLSPANLETWQKRPNSARYKKAGRTGRTPRKPALRPWRPTRHSTAAIPCWDLIDTRAE